MKKNLQKDYIKRTSIVILTWNSSRFIDTCLESLSKQTLNDFELIMVDNNSSDNTLKAIENSPWRSVVTRVIPMGKNLGCAGGNNVGWRASTGDIIIFLNPDTVVAKKWLEELIKPLRENEEIVITGCKIYYPNSHMIQHAGGVLHPNAMAEHRGRDEEDRGQYDKMEEVDYVTGASIAVKREFLEEVGGLDEDFYPAYYEETDLCWKARQEGKKVVYIPSALLYHWEMPGLEKFTPRFYYTFYKMRIRFIIKNFSLRRILFEYIPFELKWMTREPAARGFRLCQIRAWIQGIWFLITGKR